uniref:CDC20/Fizzy WD40 domain-containing protein n=1 Tax=Chrysotila carterae TaxID=13221 RepID=A0A6S9SZY3_CHRCT|mmetsp:Transcript_45399/g.98808  ORF Transcript_45399/g.98808 Transcript_45399/m.98808 type:complete len:478 (-) Transcript_45399:183-1616(-)
MTSATVSYENAFEALQGTPLKRMGSLHSDAPPCNATPKRGRTPASRNQGDRFIPHRSAMDLDVSHFELTRSCQNENASVNASPAKEEYKKELAANLFAGNASNKVLAFKSKAPRPAEDHQNSLRVLYTQNRDAGLLPKRYSRHIPQAPERILDAPELLDDYYLNLLDWNASNVLGVALGDSIYLWNATDGSIQQLMQTQGEQTHVTSLSWVQEGNYMAVGTSDHKVQIWDVERLKQVRCMSGHRARVSSLSWNGPVLSSGGRDSMVIHHDVRVAEHKIGTLRGHVQEVCGLKWSPSGNQLASGGNDNILNIWDDRYTSSSNSVCDQPLFRLDQHQAAVKALAWCPWQRHLLASGGGTADRMIRFWNANTGACLNAVDTHSQVCALQWAKHDKELVSSHGYSHNQLILWKYPSMVKVAELTGHTSRVLHMAQSPDGTTVVTAAADETLRFWKILSGGEASKKERAMAKESVLNSMSIR